MSAEDNKKPGNTENLQQKLLSTRYSVVDQIVSIKSSLDKEKMNRRRSEQKLSEMRKKILFLENQEKNQKLQAKIFQRKLSKLEQSQDVIYFMANIKGQNFREREEDLQLKKSFCHDLRTGLSQQKQKSMGYYERKKQERIKKIKEENFNSFLEKQRKSESELQSRRQKKQKIKLEEATARQRLKRYNDFKLAQAEFNYEIKKRKEAVKQQKLRQELERFKKQEQQEEFVYRKTQFLQQQTRRAQNFYLTNDQ